MQVAGDDDAFKLYVDDTEVLEKASGEADTSREVIVDLDGGRSHKLQLEYADTTGAAGVSLLWKTSTWALKCCPRRRPIRRRRRRVRRCRDRAAPRRHVHRGLGLDAELEYIIDLPADFGGIDFKVPSTARVERVVDYVRLRNAVPQAQALLTDVFAAARRLRRRPSRRCSRWSTTRPRGTRRTWLSRQLRTSRLAVPDFRSEIALDRLRA